MKCATCKKPLPSEFNIPFFSSTHGGLVSGNCPVCIAKYMGHKNGPQGEIARELWLNYKKYLKKR